MITLPGGRRHIDAEHEFRRIALRNAQRTIAGLDVGGEIGDAAHEIVAARSQRFVQQLRIGRDEIRRRQSARELPQIKLRLELRHRIGFGACDEILDPLRRDRVRLAQEIEQRAFLPLRRGETLIAGCDWNDRLRGFTGQAAERLRPQ